MGYGANGDPACGQFLSYACLRVASSWSAEGATTDALSFGQWGPTVLFLAFFLIVAVGNAGLGYAAYVMLRRFAMQRHQR